MAKICKKSVTKNGVQFDFIGGDTIGIDISQLNDETIKSAILHGLSQKIGDSYAGAESIVEATAAAEAVIRNLVAGQWNAKASRGGNIIEALHRVTKQPVEECQDVWAKMDDAKKAELRKHVGIKAALAEIAMEQAAAKLEAAGHADEGADLGGLFD